MEIFKIYKYFLSNNKLKTRFVALHGGLGTGKTTVAKKVARHLKERGQVSEIIFEDFERMKTKITKFEQKMRLGYHSKEVAYTHIRDKKILFILDNCDDLIKNNKSKFEATLNDLTQHTSAKFLIISHERFDLKLGQGTIPQIPLGQLNEYYVKQLIEFYAGDTIREYANKPQFQEQLCDLIRIMPKSPKSIMETVQNITENMDISQILTSLQNNTITDRQRDYTAFNLLIKQSIILNILKYLQQLTQNFFLIIYQNRDLKQANQQAYDMLLLISLFPHGVSVEDLKFLERKKQIPHDWIKIMESLTLFQNDLTNNRTSAELSLHDIPDIGVGLKRMQSKRPTIFQVKQEDENLEEDDFDNDQKQEETYRFKKFKNGQYFWMSVTRKFDVVVFRIKKFVVEQLKQQEYRDDLFTKEILILEYLSIFSRKLLRNLKSKSHHQERLLEYCSLSHSGIFGVHYSPLHHPPHRAAHQQSGKSLKLAETGESESENHGDITPDYFITNKGFTEDRKISVFNRDSFQLGKQHSDNIEQILFQSLTPFDIFKLHEGNFYSYLNVDDHKQMIAYINSNKCEEKKKQKIKKNIQDLCVNIPSIHKLLDELSTSEEQCQQAEFVLDELLKNVKNSQFIVAKAKLLFLKISLYVEKFVSEGNLNQSIEEVIHIDDIDSICDEIDKKFSDFDKNEIFIELIEIEKQFIIFYLIFMSFKKNKENDLSSTFEQILKVSKDARFNAVKGKVNLMLEILIPKLLNRINELKDKEEMIDEDKKDIKMNLHALNILESKIHLLNALFEQEFNTQFHLRFKELEESIRVFENCGLISLMIQTTMVYCKKKLKGLKQSRDTQNLIKLKKEMLDPAINLSKSWKLTSLEADCKKILGEINDYLHHISSNVFQFMKSQPLMMDKNTPYGHIIRLNQSFKRRVTGKLQFQIFYNQYLKLILYKTDILSKQGKELNLKFEIQTIKHFKECLQRGSKVNYNLNFMCINCDDFEDDGIIVEDDQLPLMRKYKELEMEEYYKMHYEEFGNIEILMLCTPNGIKLKEMFYRIIEKVNEQIKKMQSTPEKKSKHKNSSEERDAIAGDSELRRKPTIIAFQFNSKQKKFVRNNNKRRTTIITPKYDMAGTGDQSNTSKKNKKQNKNEKVEEFPEDNNVEEYDDFYLFYLKEFATQQFQFEFLTQLLQDKPDPNPQNHIKRAFSLAQQKMVQETIRICSQDIRDEQTFEQILGKGPELFLSDEWMDAKYDFRKGQIIDITSERPPQNLNRNFLRISGRKQDLYIILQKIQESSVNIYGQIGIGKTVVAQQIAYFTFSRNTFSDGVYYFSLKQLPDYNNDLKSLMQSLLGLQFSQDVSEYFQSQKNMLLIFDDFDYLVNQQMAKEDSKKVMFFEFIFSYINKFDIHYVLVTQKSLRSQIEQKNDQLSCIKPNMYFHEVKQFSRTESINFLDSLLDLEKINIKRIIEDRKNFEKIYKTAQGNPKKLIEQYCKKFGNPKIPQQFIDFNSQSHGSCSYILPTPSNLNLGPFNQQIQTLPLIHNSINPHNPHSIPGFPSRTKKQLISNQKSRELGNQPQVPPLNMMQVNAVNQNYNGNYINYSNPNSGRSHYKQGFNNQDINQNQHQIYQQQFSMDTSHGYNILYQQQQQNYLNNSMSYSNIGLPMQKHQSHLHQTYYPHNKINHSSSQSLILGNSSMDGSQSLIFHQNQQQKGNTLTDRKQGSSISHLSQTNLKGQIQKIAGSGYSMKSSDHIKHKSSRTLNQQQSLLLDNPQPHPTQHYQQYQHQMSFGNNQYNPHVQMMHNNYMMPSHQHHLSHPVQPNQIEQVNISNSTGNTPSISSNLNHQQFQNYQQHGQKKPLVHPQSTKNEGSSQKDIRLFRNKQEQNNFNTNQVQSDSELSKQNKFSDNLNTPFNNQPLHNNEEIIISNQNYIQFDQEDLFQNQEINEDQYFTPQEEENNHKRAGSGNNVPISQPINQYNIQNSTSFVSLTQDNLLQSQSNLSNSANLGSVNNGSQTSRKMNKSQKRSFKMTEKHIQEEHSLCQSIIDDEEISNSLGTSNNEDLDIKLGSSQFIKELFGGDSKTEDNYQTISNSQSLPQTNKNSVSNQQQRQGPLYGNDQNFSNNATIPFDYQVNNIEEEEEEYPKSDDEFINQLENQKQQEKIQQVQKQVDSVLEDQYQNQNDLQKIEKQKKDESSKNKTSQSNRRRSKNTNEFVVVEDQELNKNKNKKHRKSETIQQQVRKSIKEDGYQEEDEDGELNEDDDIDEKKTKQYIQQDIFYGNQLLVVDDDIEDKPNLKNNQNKDNNKLRTPDKNLLQFPLGTPPLIPISPSSQYVQNLAQSNFSQQHYPQFQQQPFLISGQQHILEHQVSSHSYQSNTPHNLHNYPQSNQYIFNQQPQKVQQKPHRQSKILNNIQQLDKITNDGLNNSFISNQSSQKQFDDKNRIKSNSSLPSMQPITKTDSQISKATVQSAGSQHRESLKIFNPVKTPIAGGTEYKNKLKKKINQSGKQALIYNKKKKSKYNDFKDDNQVSSSSENQSEENEE